MMSPAASLSVAGLSKAFGDSPVLAGLDLEVPAGSLTAVLGPSGCGKTTLLRLLGGFEHADGGSIRLGDRVLSDGRHPPRARSGARSASSPRRGRSSPTSTSPPTSASACRARSGAAAGSRSCWSWSTCRASASASPTSSPAASSSASRWRGRWRRNRAWSCSTSPSTPSTPACAHRCAARSARPCERPGPPPCSSPTTRRRRSRWPTSSPSCATGASSRPPTRRRSTATRSTPRSRHFVGEAVLLEGRLDGDYAETPLGRLRTRGADGADGAWATLMLRPEQIVCHERPLDGSPRGRVLATEFYGHDATARIALGGADGLEVAARCAGHRLPSVGDEVSIVVEGTALLFAGGEASPHKVPRLRRIPPAAAPPASLLGVSGGLPRG